MLPPGWLLDLTGDPAIPFLVLGCVQVAGGCFMTLAAFLQRRQHAGDSHVTA